MVRIHRRHWVITVVLVVLGVSAWGSWLARTGRADDYGRPSSLPFPASSASSPPTVPDVSWISMPSSQSTGNAEPTSLSMTVSSSEPVPVETHSLALAGLDDPMIFARRMVEVMLSYDGDTDFAARNDAVMAVAALPPIGSPPELAADLAAFTPTDDAAAKAASVVFTAQSVVPSAWAAGRITQLHMPSGSFAIDVTGIQSIRGATGGDGIPVAVTVGITGACPPTLVQCEIDQIFPNTVEQELG